MSDVVGDSLERFLVAVLIALGVATLPRWFTWVRQVPYTLLLVMVGLGLALVDVRLANLSPELILVIFLPPLLFESAWHLPWERLRANLGPILVWATLGVVIAVLGIGWVIASFTGLDYRLALLLAASLAATDPVSVIALFRELGADARLTTLLEGESLFNDGTAVVAFGVLLAGVTGSDTPLTLPGLVLNVVSVVGIGIGVGGLVGFGISYFTQRFDLPLVEQALTLVAAYGTYLLVEEFGGSGVIGVVTAGVILGNYGSRIGMSPQTRLAVTQFWEFLAFFVNSIVFLLIGDQVQWPSLEANLGSIAIAIGATVLARAVSSYGLGLAINLLLRNPISLGMQTVIWWGGLRGSVAIALALSIPTNVPGRETIVATVFGVVLFTLLVQGLTMKPLLQRLHLIPDQALQGQYNLLSARWLALRRLQLVLQQDELVMPGVVQAQCEAIQSQMVAVAAELQRLQTDNPDLQTYARDRLTERLRQEEVAVYDTLEQAGLLTEIPTSLLTEAPPL